MALSDDKLWDLWNTQGTDDMSKAEAFVFARAIEAEIRKQDEALIRQLVDALEKIDAAMPFPVAKKAIAAAHARLTPSTTAPRS